MKLKIIVLTLFVLVLGHVYYWKTGDFREDNLLRATQVKDNQAFMLSPSYSYIGHGHQSYVFASEDGQTVLKLFMNDYLQRGALKHVLPPIPPFRSWLVHTGPSKEYRRQRLLEGYRLSFQHDPVHSGLIFVHLNQSDLGKTTLVDALGFKHEIALGDYAFAIQRKATSSKKEFQKLIGQHDIPVIKERLGQLFNLYREQLGKGLYDQDRNLLDNTGFVGGDAIRQDAGKVIWSEEYQDPEKIEEELRHLIENRLIPWFSLHSEEITQWLREKL